jgi:hypothetical protein
MKKAIAVVQKDEDLDHIDRVLFSLGHSYDHARCQEEAQWLVGMKPYDYILADLLMWAREFDGNPHLPACGNLLGHVNKVHVDKSIPIILLVGLDAESMPLSVEMFMLFASIIKQAKIIDFVEKPLAKNGRKLDSTIKHVLALAALQDHPAFRQLLTEQPSLIGSLLPATFPGMAAWSKSRPAAMPTPPSAPAAAVSVCSQASTFPAPNRQQAFGGGELVIHPSHAEIQGVKVASDMGTGQSLMILRTLTRRRPNGRWWSFSGQELARRIGTDDGAVRGCIRTIRVNIRERLRDTLGVVASLQDVIQNDGIQGYCFSDRITVRAAPERLAGPHGPALVPGDPGNGPASGSDGSASDPDGPTRDPAPDSDARCRWLLASLESGPLRRDEVVRGLCCSLKTAQRTINSLKKQGRIAFVGSTRNGHYRLVGQAD